jgi:hypothetical protein
VAIGPLLYPARPALPVNGGALPGRRGHATCGDDEQVTEPPDGLPRYRLLTGPDDEAFCRRVSAALDAGYRLYGSPAVTFDGEHVIAAQALLWPDADIQGLPRPAG